MRDVFLTFLEVRLTREREDERKSNEGFKTTGVTLIGSVLSLTQFFIRTMRGLDRKVRRDDGEGSRVWVLGLDSPGMEYCYWPAV